LLDDPLRAILYKSTPLVLAVKALRHKFKDILESEGFTTAELATATLNFDFSNSKSDYLVECDSELVTMEGKSFHHSVKH